MALAKKSPSGVGETGGEMGSTGDYLSRRHSGVSIGGSDKTADIVMSSKVFTKTVSAEAMPSQSQHISQK